MIYKLNVTKLNRLLISTYIYNRNYYTSNKLLSNQFYDSQSGTYITKPGSLGLRIHDNYYKFHHNNINDKDFIEYLHSSFKLYRNLSSITIPYENNQNYKLFINKSLSYFIRNRNKLPFKISTCIYMKNQLEDILSILKENENQSKHNLLIKDTLEIEFDIVDSSLNKSKRLYGHENMILIEEYSTLLNLYNISVRVNLFLCIDSLLNKDNKSISNVIEIGEVVAILCDLGITIINLSIYSNKDDINTIDSNLISEYLQEIIEECLFLDVIGDPLSERLSIQLSSNVPELITIAKSHGLNRFTICSSKDTHSIQAFNIKHCNNTSNNNKSIKVFTTNSNDQSIVEQLNI